MRQDPASLVVARGTAIAASAVLLWLVWSAWSLASDIVNFDVVYQHGGEDKTVQACAWMPDDVPVRAMLYLCPGDTGSTRTYVSNAVYQAFARAMGFAMVGMDDRDITEGFHGTNATEATSNVQRMLDTAASGLNCPQLVNAPLAFYGFSKGGGTVNMLTSYMPARTICFMTDKSTSFVRGVTNDAARVPGLFVGGTEDHISVSNVVYGGFELWRTNANSEVALAVDWQFRPKQHKPTGLALISAFIAQCTARRYPAGQLPSVVPGNPMALNAVDFDSGWMEETCYSNGYARIRCPVAAPVPLYGLPPDTASWVPGQAMAMVLRAHNARDPDDPRINPVGMSLLTAPRVDPLTYALGQTVELQVTNRWLNLDDVSRVQIYHEERLIGDFPTLPPAGVSSPYRLVEAGVHTFWTEVTYTNDGVESCAVCTAVAFVVREQPANGSTLLVVSPEAWESATDDFVAFKRGLGFSAESVATEVLAEGGALTPSVLRTALRAYATNIVPSNALGHVLFVGDFDVIPAPSFRVRPSDGDAYESDVYYRDLATEFDADGDGTFGEYDERGTDDFTGDEVRAAFPSFTNHLIVGRLPLATSAVPADVESALAASIAFEQEVGARKDGGIMTAGRIVESVETGLPFPFNTYDIPADSWTYVLSNIVETIVTQHTNREVTTVVHVAPSYPDRHNIDYAVVGNDITGDYVYGQNIVRGLWESNDVYAFVCNVSHGGASSDFSLCRDGAGFPTNVSPAVVLSMSCASYPLGVSAWTGGIAVAYIGSVAVVTPDVESLTVTAFPSPGISGSMVSAEVQDIAVQRLFVEREGIGRAFAEALNYYTAELPGRNGGAFIQTNAAAALRNVIGYQIIGDPTLVMSYDDTDADGLLDPEEIVLGTSVTNADTDADGLPDGDEVNTFGTSPLCVNTDGDPVDDHAEYIADTDGTDSNDYFRITGISNQSPITVYFKSSSNRWYTLLWNTNLAEGTWTNVLDGRMGVGGADSMQSTNSAPREFFKLQVDVPEE